MLARLAETEHKNAKAQNEGAAVSRRMAYSISALGPKAPEACLGEKSVSLTFIFLLMYFSLGRLRP